MVTNMNELKEWRVVKKRKMAETIREKIKGSRLFGEDVKDDDIDAMLVIAFMLGREEMYEAMRKAMNSVGTP